MITTPASAITKAASKQTYYTIRFLVDRERVDDAYRAFGPHTLFLADNYRENFDRIIRDLSLPANPSLYVHAPARLDPSMAPPGQDTLIAIIPVGHLSENGNRTGTSFEIRRASMYFAGCRPSLSPTSKRISSLKRRIPLPRGANDITW